MYQTGKMTSDVALELDHHGVRLLLRNEAGDVEVGSVRLDDPDFDARLTRLRSEIGEDIPIEAAVLVPAALVLFVDVDGLDDDEVQARIDKEKPSDVEDLVVGRSKCVAAAVERATLDEARDFAILHGFEPVAYAARRPGDNAEVTFSLAPGPTPGFRSHRAAERVIPTADDGHLTPLQGAAEPVAPTVAPETAPTPTSAPSALAPANDAEALTVFGARDRRRERRSVAPLYAAAFAAAAFVLLAAFLVGGGDEDLAVVGLDDGTVEVLDPVAETAPGDAVEATAADSLPTEEPTELAGEDEASEPGGTIQGEAAPSVGDAAMASDNPPSEVLSPVDDLPAPVATSAAGAPSALVPPEAPRLAVSERTPPPPPGSLFDMDENGLVRPSEDGAPTPRGVLVYAGPPSVLPPDRPGTPEEVEAPDLVDPQVAETEDDAALTTRSSEPDSAAPEVAAIRPQLRSEDAPPPPAIVVAEATEDTLRPRSRPARPTTVQQASASSDFDALADRARTQSEAATAAITAPRAAEPPPPEPVGRMNVAVNPTLPTRTSVAKQATLANAIRLDQLNLIGVYGSPSDRRALIRLPSGRYLKVKVGDRVDGGRIAAIQASRLQYVKGGRSYDLTLPNG